MDKVNYWILPHINKNAEENFKKLIELKSWQFNKKPSDIMIGDKIIFYISKSSPYIRYFAGEARVASMPAEPTRRSVDGGEPGKYEILLKDISIWSKKIYLTNGMKEELNFIKAASNAGLAFKGRGIIKIDEHDHSVIKSKLTNPTGCMIALLFLTTSFMTMAFLAKKLFAVCNILR